MHLESNRIVDALARLQRFAHSPDHEIQPDLTIAISRQAGASGGEVARAIGNRLGWPVYDQELVKRIAQEKGVKEQLLATLDERYVGWLEEVAAALSTE